MPARTIPRPTAAEGWLFLAAALALSSLVWSGLFLLDPSDNPWVGGGSMGPGVIALFLGGGAVPSLLGFVFAFRRGSWKAVKALLARAWPHGRDPLTALVAMALAVGMALIARVAGEQFGASPPPIDVSAVPQAAVMALAAALMEEFGWRGTALPALARRIGLPIAGLVVGIVWAVWHTVGALWSVAPFFGPWFAAYYVTGIIGVMAGAGMTLAVIQDYARGGLFPVIAFHLAFSASANLVTPSAGDPAGAVKTAACFAAAHIALGVAALAWRRRRTAGEMVGD